MRLAAAVLAAVSGELGDGPGAALASLDDTPGLVRGSPTHRASARR